MGKDDWKNKKNENFTAEDWFWWAYDQSPGSYICDYAMFTFDGIVYRIYENCIVRSFQRDILTCSPEEEEQFKIQSKKYDDWEELLYDPCWNGQSLGEMMKQIPAKEVS